jgi:hypothetical protein
MYSYYGDELKIHGDNDAGIGASHQTGWTGIVSWLLMSVAILNPKEVLEKGFEAVALKMTRSVDGRHHPGVGPMSHRPGRSA